MQRMTVHREAGSTMLRPLLYPSRPVSVVAGEVAGQTLNDTTGGSNESHNTENKKKTLPDTTYWSQRPHIQESTERVTNWLKETG